MEKAKKMARVIILVVVILLTSILAAIRLMKIQIVEGEKYLELSASDIKGVQEVTAPRGEILDINGKPLVMNKVEFDAIIEYALFPSDRQKQNEIILEFAKLLLKEGVAREENLPISTTKPYTYISGKDKAVSTALEKLRLNAYATPQNCIDKLQEMYEISDKYTDDEIRIIAGVRYEMIYTQFSKDNRFVIAKNIPKETVLKIQERLFMYPGTDIVESSVRYYPDGTIFPHGLGNVGALDAEEYELLKDSGYKLNDQIGKSGIEKIMESTLRGTNGTRSIVMNKTSQVVSVEETTPAVPGQSVVLTVDGAYQKKVQNILEDHIKYLNTRTDPHKGSKAFAGSVVVLDVKTGAVRAMASYPSYDMNTYRENYDKLNSDPAQPLFNRSIYGAFRPGSTFKTLTSVAALNEGVIKEDTTFHCAHDYKFIDTEFHCLGWHNNLSVKYALNISCNIFFYETGRRLGIDKLAAYEKMFGFGTDLKFELGGRTGYIATPETFKENNWTWDAGQVLNASIGQSEISVSPLNMAVQAMTIANKGVRYRPYVIDSIWNYDHTEMLKQTQPVVDERIEDKTGETFRIVTDGMVECATRHFNELGFNRTDPLPYAVAMKTGTPQLGKWPDGTDKTDSALIGFYPAENPEIAFSIMIDDGDDARMMVKKLIQAYYEDDEVVQNIQN